MDNKNLIFDKMMSKNIDKKGATSHYEIINIVHNFLSENIAEISECLTENGIKIEDYKLKMIMDIILTDITDRIINCQITPNNYIEQRYDNKFTFPRW